jgi:hypothetical protein
MAGMNQPLTKPIRRWLQFRLRTLLVLVTLIAALLGWWMYVWRAEQEQQRQAMAAIQASGAETSVTFYSWAEAVALQGRKADNVVILDNPQLTDDDLKALDNAPLTRSLYLVGSQITDDGLVHLKNLRRLEILDLKKNKRLTDAGLVHLEGLKNLDQLILIGTQVTPAGVKQLQQKLPNTKIAL